MTWYNTPKKREQTEEERAEENEEEKEEEKDENVQIGMDQLLKELYGEMNDINPEQSKIIIDKLKSLYSISYNELKKGKKEK
jgi:hypothetical protein